MKETNMGWVTESFYKANQKTNTTKKNTEIWTREKTIDWIQKHQYIATVGDCTDIIIDGDGRDLYEAIPMN